ncbi:oxidoreductase - protein [Colletotrichum incanum]|uniref:Oxidoreductase-protein n=1 Tax=Colletotrichum incanum TaxID=1573173 RepID=A0A166ZXL8_COLIC|nr:oxidoreductase - protein [Colletotrichum incanum]
MACIKNVAHAGASGALGKAVLQGLVDAGFNVTILSRAAGKVPSSFANKIKEATVDYNDLASLKSALAGIDAVVSTLGAPAVGDAQRNLVDASVEAGVRRFIPSNFGCDQQNSLARQLPVFAEKVKTEDYLAEKAKTSPLSYTFIYNNLFLDWGITNGSLVNLKEKNVTQYNGGKLPVSVTRLETVGKAVAGVLHNPEATANRSVRIEDGKVSYAQLAQWAQEAVPGSWTTPEVDTNELKAKADEALGKGVFDDWVWFNYILQGGINEAYGPSFKDVDNKLLGLKGLSAQELEDYVKTTIKQNI